MHCIACDLTGRLSRGSRLANKQRRLRLQLHLFTVYARKRTGSSGE